MDLASTGLEAMNLFNMAQARDQLRAVVNAVTNIRFP